jgi:hypothetical protein
MCYIFLESNVLVLNFLKQCFLGFFFTSNNHFSIDSFFQDNFIMMKYNTDQNLMLQDWDAQDRNLNFY